MPVEGGVFWGLFDAVWMFGLRREDKGGGEAVGAGGSALRGKV